MSPPTPCQRCKAERDELAERNARQAEMLLDVLKRATLTEERCAELERGIRDAIARLNAFLAAFEGEPEPSENDTKNLVCRLQGVLDGETA